MLVILLAGMPGAGKEEFVKVAKEMGYVIIRMGDVVREFVKSLGLELKDSIVGGIANDERKRHGIDIWAKRTVEKIERMDEKKIVIDGIRCIEEVDIFRKKFGDNVILVGIFAPRKMRFERILKRKREDDISSWEELVKREMRELSWGLGNVFALSDYMMVNTSSLEDFRKDVRNFLLALEKEKGDP
ncbi:MAG: flagellar hook-basal body complex protein FliE [Thermoplasmata archaeon]|nr:flagellar hook-basal body complex protein FliE [Thermoplasmata archaeon]